ncbi:outer membrane protein, heavy metal efflux system [Pseudomonas sp. IT-P176]
MQGYQCVVIPPRIRKLITGPAVLLLSLAVAASALPAMAQAAPLTLERALQSAFAHNPNLAAAQWEIGVAEGDRQQAGLIPNPQVSWEAEDTRRRSRTTTLMLSQPLELGGKRGARIEVAERAQDAASIELERRRNELRADVIQAFYSSTTAQQRLSLTEQSLLLAERGLRVAQGRINAGKAAPVEAMRAQVQLSQVRLQLRRAERDQATAYQQLAQVTGAPQATFTRAEEPTSALPAIASSQILLDRLPDTAELRLARLQINQKEASLGLEKALRIPDLTVSIGSQYSEADRERVNLLGVSMPIPLFNRNQGNVLAAARRTDQARDLRNASELRLRSEVQSGLDQWATANTEVNAFNQVILPAAQSAVDSATRGFEMGKFNFLDVLDAQRTLFEARSQYLQAVADATDAWVRIERIYGDTRALFPTP